MLRLRVGLVCCRALPCVGAAFLGLANRHVPDLFHSFIFLLPLIPGCEPSPTGLAQPEAPVSHGLCSPDALADRSGGATVRALVRSSHIASPHHALRGPHYICLSESRAVTTPQRDPRGRVCVEFTRQHLPAGVVSLQTSLPSFLPSFFLSFQYRRIRYRTRKLRRTRKARSGLYLSSQGLPRVNSAHILRDMCAAAQERRSIDGRLLLKPRLADLVKGVPFEGQHHPLCVGPSHLGRDEGHKAGALQVARLE